MSWCIWGELFLCIVFGCLYVYGFPLYLGVSGVSYFYALFFGCLYVYGFLLYLGVSGVSYFYALFLVVCMCMIFCYIWVYLG